MYVNKRIGRFKQWAGERMGGEVKTNTSNDFKAMETEMSVRHEGVDRIHKSMTDYMKAIAKRSEGSDKEKTLPIAHLGSSMVSHGEDFDGASEYGQCLTMFGRTEERIARAQESYIAQANSSWLECLDRSMTQMKDYQTARKKLDSRRLAYDTSLSKMEKAKKEDFRVEEELRTQKVKYEETNDDVIRRIQDIRDAEVDNIMDLGSFLDAQLEYHDRCREALMQLKNEWPGMSGQGPPPSRGQDRALSNASNSYQDRHALLQEQPSSVTETRAPIRSTRALSTQFSESPVRDYPANNAYSRLMLNRTSTFEGPAQLRQEQPPVAPQWIQRTNTSDSWTARQNSNFSGRYPVDPYADSEEVSSYGSYGRSSPERGYSGYSGRSISPTTSLDSGVSSRRPSGTSSAGLTTGKKGPPPPPPSRAKKPPPPPPMKRTTTSTMLNA
ncbi:hypothetical protein N7495_001204 [Penicillium taxi]|uniref:uncharacterized protein n=1 Tax=Penicillium taxi TaxID=168475 RepID=UPI002544E11E|nr:uncharacterized protein N7495_001204 [Penicillium taxi]KAJ5908522.1 hypothetical protein N7495_001204 [Penicillium taxi]